MSEAAKDIEHGTLPDTGNLIAELDMQLAEDDAAPNDTVNWETIRTDALARWNT